MEIWDTAKVRIWQAVLRDMGMPPSKDALDSLIQSHVFLLDWARRAWENLDDDIENRPMRHSCGKLLAELRGVVEKEIERVNSWSN